MTATRSAFDALATAALVATFLLARSSSAQALRYDPPTDLSVTLGGAGALLVSEDLRTDLAPSACRWCDRDAAGQDTLNGVDRRMRVLRWRRLELAAALSNISAFVATPIAAGGLLGAAAARDGHAADVGADVVIVAESGVLAGDLNQLVKLVVARERPFAHVRSLSEPGIARVSVDDDLSFYSGHTTEAVSLAVAAGTVASVRRYRLAPLVWGVSLPLALATGYLRIGADRHYFTDVLVGALTGAAVGFLVPYAFHRGDASVSSSGAPGQTTLLGVSGVW